MKIAGLDIGTTGCKLTVFDEEGKYTDKAYRDYPVHRGSVHEIDAGRIADAVFAVIGEMAAKYHDIAWIGITSFGETAVLVDDSGEVLLPSMLYTDPRGKEECEKLILKSGAGDGDRGGRRIARITGLHPHEMYSLPKLMWIRDHEPAAWKRVKYVFLIEDYIVWKLTGVRQIDYSLAARTMAFDIASLDFSEEMLVNAGIDRSLFSEPVPIGTPAGRVLPGAAERSGLRPETVIVSCAHDQVAAAVGAGAFDTDILVDGAGTVECMTPVFAGLPDPDVMYDGYYSAVPYVIPGTYVCYAFSYTGGALIQWCAEMLAGKEQALAKERGIPVYGLLEDEYRQMEDSGRRRAGSPTGLLVLPHFAGAATPYMDTGSKGAILGLTTETTAADIYRACEEGVVYEMILNREHLAGSGLSCRKIHATGGGARSKVWMQMKADMLGLPVTALATPDAGTVGCAMLTGIASGIFRSFSDAAAHMVEETETYEPIPARHEKYLQVYEQYRKVYAAVRPLMGDMPAGAPADGGESRG